MKKKLVSMLIVAMAVSSLCACGKKEEVKETAETTPAIEVTTNETGVGAEESAEVVEEDVEPELLNIENHNNYYMAKQIKHAYIDGEGYQYIIAADKIGNTNDDEFGFEEFDGRPLYANIAGKTFALKENAEGTFDYDVSAMIKDPKAGFDLANMLYHEFGVYHYTNEGEYDVTFKPSDDTKINADVAVEAINDVTKAASYVNEYPDTNEKEYVFIFDADMGGYGSTYRSKYQAITGNTKDENINGELMMVVYTDEEGNCASYEISISAPCYWDSVENLEANTTNKMRFEDSKCYIVLDEMQGQKVGFTNQRIVIR